MRPARSRCWTRRCGHIAAVGVLLGVWGTAGIAGAEALRARNLLVEYQREPIGIDVSDPRFSWEVTGTARDANQSAYQIVVARSVDFDSARLWDSGRVEDDRNLNRVYRGPPLAGNTRYWWKLRLWDAARPGPWSEPQSFQLGLLDSAQWKARWIAAAALEDRAPLLRREFEVSGPVASAIVYVSALGFYELHLNGEKVGDRVLDPPPSQYERRVLYSAYDVADELNAGTNALGLMLSEGIAAASLRDPSRYYNRAKSYPGSYDAPRAIVQLEIGYPDGRRQRVVSDAAWKSASGPITFSHFYGGEDYDARLERPGWSAPDFDDSDWSEVRTYPTQGRLRAQRSPPMRVVETLEPIAHVEPTPGIHVYDLGQNIAGWWRVSARGPQGTQIAVRGSETLQGNAFPHQLTAASRLEFSSQHPLGGYYHRDAYSRYILQGHGLERFEPRFFYTGFRYLELQIEPPSALAELAVDGRVVHSDLEPIGHFACSDPYFDRLAENSRWSLKGVLHGTPTSNPHSEKYGWTGDALLLAESANHFFQSAGFWTKWLDDVRDAQSLSGRGRLPSTIPNFRTRNRSTSPTWGAAYPFITWYLYRYYADERIVAEHYEGIRQWTEFLRSGASKDRVRGIWGDHMAPGRNAHGEPVSRAITPELAPLIATAYYQATADLVSKMAAMLGKNEQAQHYRTLARSIARSFHAAYYDPERGYYRAREPTPETTSRFFPLQTANLVPLHLGLVPAGLRREVLAALVGDLQETHHDHLQTGIIGTKALVNLLPRMGFAPLLHRIVNQRSYPGWGYWVDAGATVHWQDWAGEHDHNHPMFGTVAEYLFDQLAGIEEPGESADAVGYRTVEIRPFTESGLDWASASLRTLRGEVAVRWSRRGPRLVLDLGIPGNTVGEVHLPFVPGSAVFESGEPIDRRGTASTNVKGVRAVRAAGDEIIISVGSGRYRFERLEPESGAARGGTLGD